MLRIIGIDRVEELFVDVPADARFPTLDLPPALSELEVSRHLADLAGQNVSVRDWPCFIGGGAYNHYAPSAVGHIMGQPQFYTAYTPYQPEVSQGTLQVSFEFQSLVCDLLGLDVANDSVYDGASAVGGALLIIAVADATSLGLLKSPGAWGADIATAEGQSLGLPLQYGGPWAGLMACKSEYVRQLPGRISGQTADHEGRRGFVLTLQAREQHIRREKATSNICTSQTLLAIGVTAYLALMGPVGLP